MTPEERADNILARFSFRCGDMESILERRVAVKALADAIEQAVREEREAWEKLAKNEDHWRDLGAAIRARGVGA